jgi:hypothetical protein
MQIDLTPFPLREGGTISLPLSLKEERNESEVKIVFHAYREPL